MTVRELESVLPKTCTVTCYDNKTCEVVFISHGSAHPCEGDRKHLSDEVERIITSNTHLMSGEVEVWIKEMI